MITLSLGFLEFSLIFHLLDFFNEFLYTYLINLDFLNSFRILNSRKLILFALAYMTH